MHRSPSHTDRHHEPTEPGEAAEAAPGDDDPDRRRPSPTGREPDRLGVTGSQVAGSVLASVSAAVVASYFGVTGTIVGAALVSIVATVGSAAYGLGIRRTRDRLQQLQALRLTDHLPGIRADDPGTSVPSRTSLGPAAGASDTAVGATAGAAARGGVDRRPRPALLARLAHHRWSLAAGLGLVLVLTFGAISLAELVSDRPLSGASSDGRTTIGALVSGEGGGSDPSAPASTTTSTTTAPDAAGSTPPTATDDGDEADDRTSSTTEAPATTTTTAPTPTTAPPTTAAPAPPAPSEAPVDGSAATP